MGAENAVENSADNAMGDKERACRNCVKEGAHSGRKRRGREEGIVCGTVAITQTPRIACR